MLITAGGGGGGVADLVVADAMVAVALDLELPRQCRSYDYDAVGHYLLHSYNADTTFSSNTEYFNSYPFITWIWSQEWRMFMCRSDARAYVVLNDGQT